MYGISVKNNKYKTSTLETISQVKYNFWAGFTMAIMNLFSKQ